MDDAQVASAHTAAQDAANAAAVQLRTLRAHSELTTASALFDEVWGRDPSAGAIVAPEMLRALLHAGNQVSGAFAGQEMVAATAAFLGRDPSGGLHLHSHVTGVRAGSQGRGVGLACKLHQRAWALEHAITRVRWTFDPLIRRNAVFNLTRLGARVLAYEHDVYGPMQDARNAGLPTDRLLCEWDLLERRVVRAASGQVAGPDRDRLVAAGAVPALQVAEDEMPQVAVTDAPRRLVQVPADIEAIRARDRGLAAAWASAIHEALGGPLRAGTHRVSGITPDGWYVLAADPGVEELQG